MFIAMSDPAASTTLGPGSAAAPSLPHRVAVMVYESVLLFGVVFGVGFVLLSVTGWTHPLAPGRRLLLQFLLFCAVGVYFIYCWTHGGQTLAMRSWRVKLMRSDGGDVSIARAVLRYLLAWHLFAPGLLFIAVFQAGAAAQIAALALGVAAMLALAYTDPQRQLLHDRWLGTRVVRV